MVNIIKVQTVEELDKFLDLGYEIVGKRFIWENNISTLLIALDRDGEQLIIDAYDISDYFVSLVELYDFDKKKPVFKPVSDTKLFWEFEINLNMMIVGEYDKPILIEIINTENNHLVFNKLTSILKNEKFRFYPLTKLSEIFSLLFIIKEKNNNITTSVDSKELIDLGKISLLYYDASNLDNVLGLSFFMLGKKIGKPSDYDDTIFGIVVYDIKNKKILAFNMTSLLSFIRSNNIDEKLGFYDIAEYLFNKTIEISNSNKLIFKSFIPLPFDTPLYPVLPWFTYLVLARINENTTANDIRKISIADFFLFGQQIPLNKGNSFNYDRFSSTKEGRATTIMEFHYENKPIKYVLRFDQSKGEPLVHIDFSFFNPKEQKIISHMPLNMQDVSNFNLDLFIAMMGAGLFDGHFNTLVKNSFMGINELEKENPSFLYSFKIIYKIERWLKWLNSNPIGYSILNKLFYLKKLEQTEKDFLTKMSKETKIGEYSLFKKDLDGTIKGLNMFGYMVLIRYKNQDHNISVT